MTCQRQDKHLHSKRASSQPYFWVHQFLKRNRLQMLLLKLCAVHNTMYEHATHASEQGENDKERVSMLVPVVRSCERHAALMPHVQMKQILLPTFLLSHKFLCFWMCICMFQNTLPTWSGPSERDTLTTSTCHHAD
jgi:hypothetical protein